MGNKGVSISSVTRRWFANLRVRLLLLVLAAILPIWMVTLYSDLELRHLIAADARRDVLQLASVTAAGQEQLLEGARQLLAALSELSAVSRGDPRQCNALFTHLLTQYPRYANLAAALPDGDVFCSAIPLTAPVNVHDEPWFQHTVESRGFVLGHYQIGQISRKPVVVISAPALDALGYIHSIVFAALDLDWLARFVADTQLPKWAVINMVDEHGTIVVRHPDPGPWVGRTIPDAPMVRAVLQRADEATADVPGLDGTPRVFGLARLRGTPPGAGLHIAIGMPRDVVFAEANRLLRRHLIGLGLITLLALTVARASAEWFILRPVNSLVRATERLSAGDLEVRTGVPYRGGELGQLAMAFDNMAAALQRQRAEASHAAAVLRRHAAELEQRVAERTATLREINAELESFSFSVSHDLRGPLRAMEGFSEALLQDYAAHLDAIGQGYARRIRDAAQRMSTMIQDLLAYSRLSRAELKLEPVNLNTVMTEVLTALEHELQLRGAHVEVEGALPRVIGHYATLHQIVANLLANALKFVAPGTSPSVRVWAEECADRVRLWVADNGIGIPPEHHGRIFAVFERLHGIETYPGSGIGLAIVHRGITRLGGRVGVESRDHQGSRFWVELAAARKQPASQEQGSATCRS